MESRLSANQTPGKSKRAEIYAGYTVQPYMTYMGKLRNSTISSIKLDILIVSPVNTLKQNLRVLWGIIMVYCVLNLTKYTKLFSNFKNEF